MRLPKQFIHQVNDALPVSEVVRKYISIKKHGREYKACCPFHNEKTPSFTINNEKGFYHCFGCGAHGTAIDFVKDIENIQFIEAVEKLAGYAGIALPKPDKKLEAKYDRYDELHKISQAAADYFKNNLLGDAGQYARQYIGKRGLGKQTVDRFQLGYSNNDGDSLKNHLLNQGFKEADIIATGLLIKPDTGASYNRFRGRLMFPIFNIKGAVIAFGGRILGDGEPKYLNSPETEIFKKNQVFYGLNFARTPIAKQGQAIITEGYMDVIALHKAGIQTAIAPLGTAITLNHLKLIWGHCKTPTLCMDGDNAGNRASLRAANLALPHLQGGLSLQFVSLPKGEDPDSFIQNHGADSFNQLLNNPTQLADLLFENEYKQINPKTPEQHSELKTALDNITKQIEDATTRKNYEQYFKDKLFNLRRYKKKQGKASSKASVFSGKNIKNLSYQQKYDNNCLKLLYLISKYPDLANSHDLEEEVIALKIADTAIAEHKNNYLNAKQLDIADIPLFKITSLDHANQQYDLLILENSFIKTNAEIEEISSTSQNNHSFDEKTYQKLTKLQHKLIEIKNKITTLTNPN